jgi:uncharacterized protein DUF4259
VTQSADVGAWDSGPFDNDEALDFANELDGVDPNQRMLLIREALQAALDPEDEDADDSVQPRAVAAAALVAANRSGLPVNWDYEMDVELPPIPDDLVELAALALDRIAESDTEWAELFGDAGTLEMIRSALT